MPKATAVRYHETGNPADVLRIEEIELPDPGPGQALIALRAATINPSDLGMIGGSYGRLRELPAIAGREGIGEVVAVGPETHSVQPGTCVRMPEDGVWTSHVLAAASTLQIVPGDLPPLQAAMAFVNPPTAYRLLHDFVDLQPGDWIIQNAGNSAVGFYVAQLANKLGLKCISIVRDADKWDQPLRKAGATLVLNDERDYPKQLPTLTGGAKPRLALNSVGGESAMNLIKATGDHGVVVTFGGMTGDKVRFPTRFLIFNDIQLRGFWMDRWFRSAPTGEAADLMQQVYDLISEGTFEGPVDSTFPLTKALEAVEQAAASGRKGKVLLTNEE